MGAGCQKDLAALEARNFQPHLPLSRKVQEARNGVHNPYCHIAHMMKPPYKCQEGLESFQVCEHIYMLGGRHSATLQRQKLLGSGHFQTSPYVLVIWRSIISFIH